MISGSTRLACVIGNPVRHSKSPLLHNAAFAATGIDGSYVAFEVDYGSAKEAIEAMRSLKLLGMNVTMPFKSEIAELVDELTPGAQALNSVNLVFWNDGKLVGDSTDGLGFVRAFESEFADGFTDKAVVVVGAGGAARSIISALADTNPASISVVNRSKDSAQTAAALAEVALVETQDCIKDADIVINTTSVGMAGTDAAGECPVDTDLLSPAQIVVDIIYNPEVTPLLLAASELGCRTQGGLPMLVHQAALSFEAWTGAKAPIADMLSAAQKAL